MTVSESTIIRDRTAAYYARAAALIAADPLAFYTRAERGRRFQKWLRTYTRTACEVVALDARRARRGAR